LRKLDETAKSASSSGSLAGPNGAGKSTFYHAHLKPAGLRFLNADEVSRELDIDAYEASRVVAELRQELVKQGESFVLETVFSDPVSDKLNFLKGAAQVWAHRNPLFHRHFQSRKIRRTSCYACVSGRA